eukprot:CAMPEP_0176453102 /NCGR_PEP_ID=MMETSP0127-20121128/29007_1 /TAXON_ID=938130 /ORGANISM="Platyophrya macrostoma, Strain WH" /LENGTH=46 /DNA_ID= /DNA_START= /DNA_END= /DNA_ORIENTATION=
MSLTLASVNFQLVDLPADSGGHKAGTVVLQCLRFYVLLKEFWALNT